MKTQPLSQPQPQAERILLIEDDPGLQRQMNWALEPFTVVVAKSREEALRIVSADGPFRIVLLDLGLPPDRDGATEGLKSLDEILSLNPRTKVIVLSGNSDRRNAVRAVAQGAFDFIAKPADIEVLKLIIDRALRMDMLEEENQALKQSTAGVSGMIYGSAAMAQVAKMIERVGRTDVSVLITGESGTGKELVARGLHEASTRRNERFLAINCASIPEQLLESELFGHERGAFTGAVKQTQGKFELADRGTLFLDEIGDMPLALQAKLLRFLQHRQFERVGGRTSITVNVRIVSATNKNLDVLVADGHFREDLFYRLNEIRIELPGLRDREGDALLLARHFLNLFSRANNRNLRGLSEDAVMAISAYHWPGNVRELENRVKRAVVMAEGPLVTAADFDLKTETQGSPTNLNMRERTEELERSLLEKALALADGNVSKAAKMLGISRPHLYTLKKNLDLQ